MFGGPGGGPGGGPPGGDQVDAKLLEYLEERRGNAKYLVAGTSAMSVSPIILNTDEPVIDLGGFMGSDPVLSQERLAELVREGEVRYFLMPGGGPMGQPAPGSG